MPRSDTARKRLRAFRDSLSLSLRKAAAQLHVSHPTLKDWEDGKKIPAPAYRDAIKTWTRGEIEPGDWLASANERAIVKNAMKVKPAEESETNLAAAAERAGNGTDG